MSNVLPRGAGERQSFIEVVRNFDESLMEAGKGPLRSDDFKSGTVYQNYYIARNKKDESLKIIGLGERIIIAIKSMIWDDVPEVIDCRNDEIVEENAGAGANKPDKNTLLRTIDNVFQEKTKGRDILRVAPWDRKEKAATPAAPPPPAAAYSPKASINATMASAGAVVPASDDIPPPPPLPEIHKELFDQIHTLEEQVRSLREQLAKAPKDVGAPALAAAASVPNTELEKLQAENQRLERELAGLRKEDDVLKVNLAQVSIERDGINAQLESVRAELAKLIEESQKLQDKYAGAVATNVTGRSTLKQKTADLEQLRSAFQLKETQLEEALKTLRGLDTVMDSRDKALTASLATGHRLEKQQTMTKLNALQTRLETLTDQLKAKDEQLAKLQAQVEASEQLVTQTQSEREKAVSDLNTQQQSVVNGLKAEVAQLKAQLNRFEQEVPKLRGAEQQFAASQKELARVSNQVKDLQRQLTTAREQQVKEPIPVATSAGASAGKGNALTAAGPAGAAEADKKEFGAAKAPEKEITEEELDALVHKTERPPGTWVIEYAKERDPLSKILARTQVARSLVNAYKELGQFYTEKNAYRPNAADVASGRKKLADENFNKRLDALREQITQLSNKYYIGMDKVPFPVDANAALAAFNKVNENIPRLEKSANIARAKTALAKLVEKDIALQQSVKSGGSLVKHLDALKLEVATDPSKTEEMIEVIEQAVNARVMYEQALAARNGARDLFVRYAKSI